MRAAIIFLGLAGSAAAEEVPQLRPPANLTVPPASALTLRPGIKYVVFAPGTGTQADPVDQITYDDTIWLSTGRTIEVNRDDESIVQNLDDVLPELFGAMKEGEARRYWVLGGESQRLGDGKHALTIDVTIKALEHNIDALPDGLRIEHEEDTITLVRGTTRVLFPERFLQKARFVRDTLRLTTAEGCESAVPVDYTLDQLNAMIASAEKDFDRAVALWPTNADYVYQRAVAHLATRSPTDVLAELEQALGKDPIYVYAQIYRRPELAGLIPAIPAVARPRSVDIHQILYEPARRLYAIPVPASSLAIDDRDLLSIGIFDHTGKLVVFIDDAITHEPDEPPVVRVDAARLLGSLGFRRAKVQAPPAGIKRKPLPDFEHVTRTVFLPSERLLLRFYTVEAEAETCGTSGFEERSVDVQKVP